MRGLNAKGVEAEVSSSAAVDVAKEKARSAAMVKGLPSSVSESPVKVAKEAGQKGDLPAIRRPATSTAAATVEGGNFRISASQIASGNKSIAAPAAGRSPSA